MKSVLIASLAIGLMTSGSAFAQRLSPPAEIPGLSGIVTQVQSNDSYRVNELQDEVRRLNGKVEELNFLLLQLQEKLRKMEEDNESRFQELEEKQSSVEQRSGTQQTAKAKTPEDSSGDESLGKPKASAEINSSDAKPSKTSKNQAQGSLEPRALGTLTFDKDGNVVDAKPQGGNETDGLSGIFNNGVDGSVEASEFGATPSEVFKTAKAALDARNFKKAEQGFAALLKAWPKDPGAGEAKYYLGEALFWQKNYYASANVHLDAHNNFPEAETAADNLLGLGLALAGLNQREVACVTYAEVLKQYPEASPRLGERVKDEQAAARC